MFSEREQSVIDWGKKNGKSPDEISDAIFRMRSGIAPASAGVVKKSQDNTPLSNKITEAVGLGGATQVFGDILSRRGFAPVTPEQKRVEQLTGVTQQQSAQQYIEEPTGKQFAGALTQTLSVPVGLAVTGGASLPTQIALNAGFGYLYDVGGNLAEGQEGVGVAMPGGATIAGALVPPVFRGISVAAGPLLRPIGRALARPTVDATKEAIQGGAETVTDAVSPAITPLMRTAKEYAVNRPSRLLNRIGDAMEESKRVTELYNQGTPEIKLAIDAGLDNRIITAVTEADDATKAGYKQVVKIAEQGKTSLGSQTRPEIVAGNAAADQYKLIDTKRREVGQQIGAAIDEISTTQRFDATPLYQEVGNTLTANGIRVEKGVLDFSGTSYTDKQRTAIQKLFYLLTETGDTITPRQLYNKDRLLSQLQREARFDGVSNIFVKTPDGKEVDLFSALRQTFSNELEEIAPDIKPLNREYQQLRGLQDDIESTIFRSGNYQGTANIDPAEFAQTNLRRAFSDAQSAADYRAIYNNLDAYSRSLGYEGARADDLAAFAIEMRKLYPDSIPPTSATNVFSGAFEAVKSVIGAGKADVRDQQKALRALLGIDESVSLNSAQGVVAGIEIDKDGNVSFNPFSAAVGVAAVGATSRATGGKQINVQTVARNMSKEDRNLITNYLDGDDSLAAFKKVEPFLRGTNVPDTASFEQIRDFLRAVLKASNL